MPKAKMPMKKMPMKKMDGGGMPLSPEKTRQRNEKSARKGKNPKTLKRPVA